MQQAPTITENFEFWLPIEKAGTVKDKDGKVYRRIKGIASTEDKDLQGEVVRQGGIDFDYFLKHGFFNNDHKPGFQNKVGFPTTAKITKDGFYVEGALFNNHKIADDIWNLMHAMEATPGSNRNVGFSVQGKVKRRIGNQVLESWIQDVAITPAPINTKTWAQMVKSLTDQNKALTAGYATKNQTGGDALRTESLDDKEKNLTWSDKVRQRRLSKADTVAYIQLKKGFSRRTAEKVADVIFDNLAE